MSDHMKNKFGIEFSARGANKHINAKGDVFLHAYVICSQKITRNRIKSNEKMMQSKCDCESSMD